MCPFATVLFSIRRVLQLPRERLIMRRLRLPPSLRISQRISNLRTSANLR